MGQRGRMGPMRRIGMGQRGRRGHRGQEMHEHTSPTSPTSHATTLAEIEVLERRRAKTADMKQGMMQELLTGKTRLV